METRQDVTLYGPGEDKRAANLTPCIDDLIFLLCPCPKYLHWVRRWEVVFDVLMRKKNDRVD